MTNILNEKFHTWLDVERAFKKLTNNLTHFDNGINNITCYSDGVEIFINDLENENRAKEWLAANFSKKFDESTNNIILEIGNTSYPITYTIEEYYDGKLSKYPLWSDLAYQEEMQIMQPLPWIDGPKIVVFDSFKGGVGRTTSLMTYVSACVKSTEEKPVKILVIDADLEAPGISFWLEKTNRPTVSFIKLMEGLHYPPIDTDTTLKYFANELKKTSLTIDGNKEVFILPAALDVREILDMPVLPEHLARNPDNPWQLSDYLHSLGKYLDVSVIFIDLRAGVSELSSTLLFDPRIERFIVSTITLQSITGIKIILDRLSTFNKFTEPPTIILSMLTDDLKRLPDYTKAIEVINEAYTFEHEDEECLTKSVEILEANFESNFMNINNVSKAIDVLQQSSLFKIAVSWASEINNVSNIVSEQVPENISAQAKKLYDVCEKFQFAETGASDSMLVTEPLRNMTKHFSQTLPSIVSIGSKGAGKTFNFIQICKQNSWQKFLTQIDGVARSSNDILIFPFLLSSNLEKESKHSVDACRKHCFSEFGLVDKEYSFQELKVRIAENLNNKTIEWNTFWRREILFAFELGGERLADLNTFVKNQNKQIIILVDGIEDLFDSPNESNHADAIDALFRLTDWIDELNSSALGFICFARQDYVRTVIKQNSSQFEARFAAFKLVWTPETFLRLTYWICGEANIIGAKSESADKYTMDKLLDGLEKLWGKKLGKNGSKEANSARWIFAALCDLKGQLQARDIVRFLKFAALQMVNVGSGVWNDRVLAPEAIRKAIPECSKEKVEEAVKEIKALREWKEKLDSISEKKLPFKPEDMTLSREQLSALSDLGIIYEDKELAVNERFYVPEIYRYGLGFNTTGGARPRILALLKRNLGGMPF